MLSLPEKQLSGVTNPVKNLCIPFDLIPTSMFVVRTRNNQHRSDLVLGK